MPLKFETREVGSSIRRDKSKPKSGDNKVSVVLKKTAEVPIETPQTLEGLQMLIEKYGIAKVVERLETQLGTDARNDIRKEFEQLTKGSPADAFMQKAWVQFSSQPDLDISKLMTDAGSPDQFTATHIRPLAEKMAAEGGGDADYMSLIDREGTVGDGE